MKLTTDDQTGGIYLRLDEAQIVESEEIKPGIVLDLDEDGKVVGIEILNASSRT